MKRTTTWSGNFSFNHGSDVFLKTEEQRAHYAYADSLLQGKSPEEAAEFVCEHALKDYRLFCAVTSIEYNGNLCNAVAHAVNTPRKNHPRDLEWYWLVGCALRQPTEEVFSLIKEGTEDAKVRLMKTLVRDILAAGFGGGSWWFF